MNEYLEAEKEAGRYEAAQESECGSKTVKERSARKFRQVVTKYALQESSAKLLQNMPNHLSLKVVQIGREHGEGLGPKLLRREFLGQKWVLRQYSLLMISLRKKRELASTTFVCHRN